MVSVSREEFEETAPRTFLLEPSSTALRSVIALILGTVLFVFVRRFLRRDHSLNFNEVNDVPVISLHVSVLKAPGFPDRGRKKYLR